MATASPTFFNQFYEDVMHGVHDFETDVFTVALCTHAEIPVVADAILSNLNPISYTNLSSRVISTTTSEGSSGSYLWLPTDLVLTASGAVATFRHVVIYNDTPSSPLNPLVCWYDYGANLTLADSETLTLNFTGSALTLT